MLLQSTGVLECICTRSGTSKLITTVEVSRFDDIICLNDAILAVARSGRLYCVEHSPQSDVDVNVPAVNNTIVTTLTDPTLGLRVSRKRNRLLFDSNGEVYLVVRLSSSVSCLFVVYKLNREGRVWEMVVSLGDRVLFVTVDDCFFACVSDLRLPCYLGNCIAFPKDCFPDVHRLNYPDEVLFEGVPEYNSIGVHKYGEGFDFTLISSLHGYSDLLRPPPSCISDDRGSEEDRIDQQQPEFQKQCVSGASSRFCLVIKGYQDDENKKVQTEPISGDEIVFPSETQVGEPSADVNVEDQHNADMNGNRIIICALEAQARVPSAQTNVQGRVARRVFSVLEAQPSEPPPVSPDTGLICRVAAGEEPLAENSATTDDGVCVLVPVGFAM